MSDNRVDSKQIHKHIKLSSKRLFKVKSGASILYTFGANDPVAKEQFLEARRMSAVFDPPENDPNAQPCDSKSQSLHESKRSIKAVMPSKSDTSLNHLLLPKRNTLLFIPDLKDKLLKGFEDVIESSKELNLYKKPSSPDKLPEITSLKKTVSFSNPQRKSVRKQRSSATTSEALVGNHSVRYGDRVNKSVMDRLWAEEHNVALNRLQSLHIQQKRQAVDDLEYAEVHKGHRRATSDAKARPQPEIKPLILKPNFRSSRSQDNRSILGEKDESPRKSSRKSSMSPDRGIHQNKLKFRKDIDLSLINADHRRISNQIFAFKLRMPDDDYNLTAAATQAREMTYDGSTATLEEIQKTKERFSSMDYGLDGLGLQKGLSLQDRSTKPEFKSYRRGLSEGNYENIIKGRLDLLGAEKTQAKGDLYERIQERQAQSSKSLAQGFKLINPNPIISARVRPLDNSDLIYSPTRQQLDFVWEGNERLQEMPSLSTINQFKMFQDSKPKPTQQSNERSARVANDTLSELKRDLKDGLAKRRGNKNKTGEDNRRALLEKSSLSTLLAANSLVHLSWSQQKGDSWSQRTKKKSQN